MRQIALDTETTGIGHDKGHRIIEIGCIELINRKMTGNTFHVYLNPEREVDPGAFKVHGISNEFLKDKPLFEHVASEFLEFVKGAELIIHNAPFDTGFINAEFARLSDKPDLASVSTVLDTLVMAREKHPGQRNTLDALCKRYSIDNSNRQLHGALLDAEILAKVYLAMTGGQFNLFTDEEALEDNIAVNLKEKTADMIDFSFPVVLATAEEMEVHEKFVRNLAVKAKVDYW